MKKIKVLGVPFDICTKQEALERISARLCGTNRAQVQIVTPNPEMVLAALNDPRFFNVLNRAWMSVPDGNGILWAASFQKSSGVFRERITGVDLMQGICAICEKMGLTIFLLGAGEGVAQKTAEALKRIFPAIRIAGTHVGSPHEPERKRILEEIQNTRPDILFVAYGAPAQELWINNNLAQMPSVKMAMGVGGAFDFIAGVRKRAPLWMQKHGLEWLFRLIQEPKRFRRIYNATVKFPLAVKRGGTRSG